MNPDLRTAFEVSLERLLRGEATLEQCLREFPKHRGELHNLLVIALDLERMAPLPMSDTEMRRGLVLLQGEIDRRRQRVVSTTPHQPLRGRIAAGLAQFRPLRLASLVATFAIAIIAYGGVTLAAVGSGPDSALYGYRLALEEFRISFAADEDRAALYLDTAEERLHEIERTAAKGDPQALERASDAYESTLRKGVSVLGDVSVNPTPQRRERAVAIIKAFRTRLRQHERRFAQITLAVASPIQAPVTRAGTSASAGLANLESGPILALAPTPSAEPQTSPNPSAPAVTQRPHVSPVSSPTPRVAVPTPELAAISPTPQSNAGVVEATGTEAVLIGVLDRLEEARVVISGVEMHVPVGPGAPKIDPAEFGIGSWVEAVAVLNSDGLLTLQSLGLLSPPINDPDTETPAPTQSPAPQVAGIDSTPPLRPSLQGTLQSFDPSGLVVAGVAFGFPDNQPLKIYGSPTVGGTVRVEFEIVTSDDGHAVLLARVLTAAQPRTAQKAPGTVVQIEGIVESLNTEMVRVTGQTVWIRNGEVPTEMEGVIAVGKKVRIDAISAGAGYKALRVVTIDTAAQVATPDTVPAG